MWMQVHALLDDVSCLTLPPPSPATCTLGCYIPSIQLSKPGLQNIAACPCMQSHLTVTTSGKKHLEANYKPAKFTVHAISGLWLANVHYMLDLHVVKFLHI